MEPSLATSVGKMQLDKPAMLASGILGISLENESFMYHFIRKWVQMDPFLYQMGPF